MQQHIFLKVCRGLLWTLLIGLTNPTNAQQANGVSCPNRPITVGVYEFGQFYHSGAGLDPDIIQLMEARSGCKFSIQPMVRGNIWQALHIGSIDMTLSAMATPGRAIFTWAIPYIWLKNVVILNRNVSTDVKSSTDFVTAPNLHLGVVRGAYYGGAYDDIVAQLRNIGRVDETGDEDRLFAMLDGNRFQAVLAPSMVYPVYLKSDAYRVEDWAPANPRMSVNLLISKKNFNQDDAKRWTDLVNTMIGDGSLRKILEKYVSPDEATKMLTAEKVR